MITLSILIFIVLIVSTYRVYRQCGSWEDFNPYDTNGIVGILFIGSLLCSIIILVNVCIFYLP